MALDDLAKTAATEHDISAETTKAATAVNLGKSGLPRNAYCTVFITVITDEDVGDVTFTFQYTTDNGTTWYSAGSGVLAEASVQTAAGIGRNVSFPIGLTDILPEKNAAADIDWRVTSTIAATVAVDDNFTWQAFIADHQGARAPID